MGVTNKDRRRFRQTLNVERSDLIQAMQGLDAASNGRARAQRPDPDSATTGLLMVACSISPLQLSLNAYSPSPSSSQAVRIVSFAVGFMDGGNKYPSMHLEGRNVYSVANDMAHSLHATHRTSSTQVRCLGRYAEPNSLEATTSVAYGDNPILSSMMRPTEGLILRLLAYLIRAVHRYGLCPEGYCRS